MHSKWPVLILIYAVLLLSSFLYEEFSENPDRSFNTISSGDISSTSVLVLGDLEGDEFYFRELISEFSTNYTVYHFDYAKAADSLEAHSVSRLAKHAHSQISRIRSDKFYIVTNGFGSVIASELIKLDNSFNLVLVDPEGILEFELLGGYHLNRGVYAVSWGLTWFIENLTPDFGFFSNQSFNQTNTRIRLNTDLRALRTNLQSYDIPAVIINSDESDNQQRSISSELNRVIQKSIVFDNELSANEIVQETEALQTKSEISVRRQIQSLVPFSNSNIIKAEGWLLIGLMLLIIFSTFISEDLACLGAGLMAARGLMGFEFAVTASFLGIFFGDILIYVAGRWLGTSSTEKAPLKWFISAKDIERSNQWFQAKGPAIILMSRFIPGTRFATYFSAGIFGTSFSRFLLYFGVAALIWTPILVGASLYLGQELIFYFSLYQDYALLVLITAIILAFIVLKIIIPLFTYRGRRLLYGRLQRIIKWEFWSPFILYTPVVFYVLFLWLKFKKLTIVTAANPAIPHGGFKGESKSKILDSIISRDDVAKYLLLSYDKNSEELFDSVQNFMESYTLSFPVVLKPDEGERGRDVKIVHSENEIVEVLSSLEDVYILQEFIEGEEFGVFYFRYPNEENGQIFSITGKEKLFIRGDGKNTLERLILKNDRSVCMAQTHFDKHADHLFDIPDKGEKIQLVELGTHSRGAIFTDEQQLITSELTKKIDEISKSFDGFHFGRFDVIVPNVKSLKSGEDIKVIELNGLTSESTNIYDAKHSFVFAVKTLCEQWKIAFEIGNQNHKKGTNIPSFKEVMKTIVSSYY